MEKNETNEDSKWPFELDSVNLVDLVVIGLLVLLVFLIITEFLLNRSHQRKMQTIFSDFFRFYIHVSKPPSKEFNQTEIFNDLYAKLSLSSVSMSISTPSLSSSTDETSSKPKSSSSESPIEKSLRLEKKVNDSIAMAKAQNYEMLNETGHLRAKKKPTVRFSKTKTNINKRQYPGNGSTDYSFFPDWTKL